jgi:hypothetical protein
MWGTLSEFGLSLEVVTVIQARDDMGALEQVECGKGGKEGLGMDPEGPVDGLNVKFQREESHMHVRKYHMKSLCTIKKRGLGT